MPAPRSTRPGTPSPTAAKSSTPTPAASARADRASAVDASRRLAPSDAGRPADRGDDARVSGPADAVARHPAGAGAIASAMAQRPPGADRDVERGDVDRHGQRLGAADVEAGDERTGRQPSARARSDSPVVGVEQVHARGVDRQLQHLAGRQAGCACRGGPRRGPAGARTCRHASATRRRPRSGGSVTATCTISSDPSDSTRSTVTSITRSAAHPARRPRRRRTRAGCPSDDLVAHPVGHAGVGRRHRRVERQPLGPEAERQARRRRRPPARPWPANRFMAGEPMNVATNRLTGSSYRRWGVSTC